MSSMTCPLVVEGGWGSSPPSAAEKRTDRRKLFTLFKPDKSSFLTSNTRSSQKAMPGRIRVNTSIVETTSQFETRFSGLLCEEGKYECASSHLCANHHTLISLQTNRSQHRPTRLDHSLYFYGNHVCNCLLLIAYGTRPGRRIYSRNTTKPERLLEPCSERSLAGGRGLTVSFQHNLTLMKR
jgi:hypothetical protein